MINALGFAATLIAAVGLALLWLMLGFDRQKNMIVTGDGVFGSSRQYADIDGQTMLGQTAHRSMASLLG
ncbi:hypothetical protein [Leptothoe kymatousa]|uniref:Uncharacterized protein n=1 Tax=Leptothoe kymatousa TAU-MAC 1615 TaxID=2364775 RepID=A0ABS5Y5H5_9CYAN|nr:hypothetical protein [Leptothoe kymatousa]MBT9312614.1 hypothetical protein [Leptothoe kymatousa TAU-MAC 1615]